MPACSSSRQNGSPPRAWGQSGLDPRTSRIFRFTPTGVGTIGARPERRVSLAVHPHGRGDNNVVSQRCHNTCGSPPRAWGQFQERNEYAQHRPVHPHGRGDNCWSPRSSAKSSGSPPRAWGQCWCPFRKRCEPRFTPTGVGTIAGFSPKLPLDKVHPHGRGDNDIGFWRKSARTWFTPTGVGTITQKRRRNQQPPVHPHGRGDNERVGEPVAVVGGSPPRAWGQCVAHNPAHNPTRFTPTGVGTILSLRVNRSVVAVHPHGRGDNGSSTRITPRSVGSPPRAWGQSSLSVRRASFPRFTPTGVGTIRSCGNNSGSVSVHPHGRGDNCEYAKSQALHSGSPPRAWGQSPKSRPTRAGMRFTPTGVGTIGVGRLPPPRGAGSPPRAWGQLRRVSGTTPPSRFTPTGVGTIRR